MKEADQTDESLMGRFQESLDDRAFEELVCRYHRPAIMFARSQLGNMATAEDVVQETFVKVVKSRASYDPARRFATWFYSILRNGCIDCRRRESTYGKALDQVAAKPEESVVPTAGTEDVSELIRSLSPAEQELLILRIVHGMTFGEIASQMGCSEESAKKRSQRALQKLRRDVPAGRAEPYPMVNR